MSDDREGVLRANGVPNVMILYLRNQLATLIQKFIVFVVEQSFTERVDFSHFIPQYLEMIRSNDLCQFWRFNDRMAIEGLVFHLS